MKKIYINIALLPLLLLCFSASAQTIKASIGAGSQPNRIKLYLTTDVSQTSTISTLQFNVGVDASTVTTAPALTVFSNALGATWVVDPPVNEGGYWNYSIYTATSPLQPVFTAATDFEAMELEFSNGIPATGRAGLVTLPLGGSTGFSMFYCSGSVNSDGVNNLYYSRSGSAGLVIDNQNSYDAGFSTGTGTSFATFPLQVLPVRFLNFTATKSNNSATLNWAVENEDENTATYEILKSINGTDFTTLVTLPALNNGRSSNSYSFVVDKLSSIRTAGLVYFRIKQIDKDGRFAYTDIKNVRVDGKKLAVYPNPVKTTANVTYNLAENTAVTISIIDAAGKQVSTLQTQGFIGDNLKNIDLSKFAAGNYTVKVQTANETQVIPVIKVQN